LHSGKDREKSPKSLIFSFIQLVGIIPKSFEIPVQVPPDQVDKAREIVKLSGGKEQNLQNMKSWAGTNVEVSLMAPGFICLWHPRFF
jgi:hypothetical protein